MTDPENPSANALAESRQVLEDGYEPIRKRTPRPRALYRRMTVAEAKELHAGARVPFVANDGTAREITINGRPKVWKSKQNIGRVKVPVKYGLYEYTQAHETGDGFVDLLLVKLGDVPADDPADPKAKG